MLSQRSVIDSPIHDVDLWQPKAAVLCTGAYPASLKRPSEARIDHHQVRIDPFGRGRRDRTQTSSQGRSYPARPAQRCSPNPAQIDRSTRKLGHRGLAVGAPLGHQHHDLDLGASAASCSSTQSPLQFTAGASSPSSSRSCARCPAQDRHRLEAAGQVHRCLPASAGGAPASRVPLGAGITSRRPPHQRQAERRRPSARAPAAADRRWTTSHRCEEKYRTKRCESLHDVTSLNRTPHLGPPAPSAQVDHSSYLPFHRGS